MHIHLFFFAALGSLVCAIPQGLLGGLLGGLTGALGPVLNAIPFLGTDPPAAITTRQPSPQCANVNGGALLCCNSAINGDMPLVVQLSQLVGSFRLNPNSINGLYCKRSFTTCNPGVKLCCEVDALADPPIINDVLSLALYCQNAPSQDTTCPT